jgi:uncharacterized protein YcnI
MKSLIATTSIVALTAASAASAHVVLERWEENAGYQSFMTLVVPHGCGASPTTEVRMKVPEGVAVIVPEPELGWTLQVVRKKLDKPIAGEGGRPISEIVDEVVWSGGNLPTDHLGRFDFLALMPNAPGKVMYFKTIQKCAQGEERWVDTVPENEPIWKVWAKKAPSPFVTLKQPASPQLGATMQQIGEERKKLGGGPPAQ